MTEKEINDIINTYRRWRDNAEHSGLMEEAESLTRQMAYWEHVRANECAELPIQRAPLPGRNAHITDGPVRATTDPEQYQG